MLIPNDVPHPFGRNTAAPGRPGLIASITLAFLLGGLSACVQAKAGSPITIPMTAARWEPSGEVRFVSLGGVPDGVLELKKGSAVLGGLIFGDGTIEFDTKLTGKGILGIRFRRQDKSNADVLYLRPQSDCPTSNDCMQYMPQSHGSFEWDLFPEYQTAAPIDSNGWNHIRMVVSGKRMLVYVNHRSIPTLTIGHLEGDALRGGLSFHGPASFANLVVTPGEVGKLARHAVPDVTAADPNYLTDWLVSGSVVMTSHIDAVVDGPTGDSVDYGQMPGAEGQWRRVAAERKGLVNLTHAIGSDSSGKSISLAWAKTRIDSDRARTVHVALGWAREIWIFVNGRHVFADRNIFGVASLAKKPGAAVSLRNGGFNLPLVKGSNDVVVAIDDNFPGGSHFGWGYIMRLDAVRGLKINRT